MKKIFFILLLLAPVLTKAQIASFTISTDTVCQDSCITFINTSTGHIDSLSWSVAGDSLTNPHSGTITVCFSSAGIDTVKLYIYDSGRVDTATQVVSIKPMPHPRLIDTLPFFYIFPCGLYVPDVYISYKWYFVNGSVFANGDTTNYTPSAYSSLAFVVVDSNGCYGRSDTLGPCIEGVRNIKNPDPNINLFPNPVTDELTITTNTPISTLSISNLLGQSVFTSDRNAEKVELDVSSLPTGIYFIRINGTEVRKFVKQ